MGCRSARSTVLALAGALVMSACGARSAAVDQYPELGEHAGSRISNVNFENTDPFGSDTLLLVVQTQPSRCSFLGLPFCVPFTSIGREEHHLSPGRVVADIQALERFYRVAGYFGTTVVPDVEPDGDDVDVTFTIDRGDPVVLDYIQVTGTEEVVAPDSLAEELPLRPGDIFHLGRFIESSDYVLRRMQRQGHAYAEVLRSFSVDTVDRRAEATLDAVPGPRVTVDSIIVRGADNLGRQNALRQLEIRPGDLLLSTALLESQRNLYALELVSLASVTISNDTAQADPTDRSTATVTVSIVEAPVHEVEAAIGFGTEECLRTEARWVSRSFGGGARRLSLRGSLSRLGVGEPFAIGAGRNVCPGLVGDSVFGGDRFDYRFVAALTQPYFLGPRNQLSVSAFADRLSEPGVFTRQAIGGGANVARRLGARSGTSAGVEFERGQTRASAALFCAAFLVCEPETIDSLSRTRLRAEVNANYFLDATNNAINPSGGFLARTAISYATPLLGSQIRFFRWNGDGTYYLQPRQQWVAALSLRLGNFFRTATVDPTGGNFLPPEDRFYAGGASTVRGYERNALGPGVYVTDSIEVAAGDTTFPRPIRFMPTGGTAVGIVNAELRLPSPVLARLLRLALFVDAGAVGTGAVWDLGPDDWRITPGAGVRMTTPVGPVRIDVALNPHDRTAGPLYLNDVESGRLRRLQDEYRPEPGSFFSRLRVHLGVGHAF